MTSNNEENKEKLMEENLDRAPNAEDTNIEVNDEELQRFYEENKDAIDLIGGLDMFESLMSLDDEEFNTLKPQFLTMMVEVLNEEESINELRA